MKQVTDVSIHILNGDPKHTHTNKQKIEISFYKIKNLHVRSDSVFPKRRIPRRFSGGSQSIKANNFPVIIPP